MKKLLLIILSTIAGSLWLAMFVMALKKRRQDKNPPEITEENDTL